MLTRRDDLQLLPSDEATRLIIRVRELAREHQHMLEDKDTPTKFKDWRDLMLAAAELERAYIKLGIISDERYNLHGWPYLRKLSGGGMILERGQKNGISKP